MAIEIDDELFSPAVRLNPFAYYGALRDRDPVHWNEKYQVWIVTSYDHVVQIARQPEYFSIERTRDKRPPYPPIDSKDSAQFQFVKEFRGLEIVRNDPPDHTRMRTVMHRFFSPKAMEDWRNYVRTCIEELLSKVQDSQGMDVVADLGAQLPLKVIVHLLGLPQRDGSYLLEQANKHMSDDMSSSPNRMRVSAEGIHALTDYLTPFVEERLRSPKVDLLTLLALGEKGGSCSREEALANAMLLVDAGFETTIKLICNGTLALLRHPEQFALLRATPSLASSATEECLRFDPPVPYLLRYAAQDLRLDGKLIRKGDRLEAQVISAGTPRSFPTPTDLILGVRPTTT